MLPGEKYLKQQNLTYALRQGVIGWFEFFEKWKLVDSEDKLEYLDCNCNRGKHYNNDDETSNQYDLCTLCDYNS